MEQRCKFSLYVVNYFRAEMDSFFRPYMGSVSWSARYLHVFLLESVIIQVLPVVLKIWDIKILKDATRRSNLEYTQSTE
jgi:hypothetical protein